MMPGTGQVGRTLALVGVVSGFLMSLAGPSRLALAGFEFEVVKSFGVAETSPGRLIVGSDGAFYGTTRHGGPSSMGTVFRIDTAGNFTNLHSFDGTDGAYPQGPLVVGSDGALYGTARTVFRIDSAGNFTILREFGGTNGASGVLVVGNDGALYGTTYGGDSSNIGAIFRIENTGAFTLLHSFDGSGGTYPFFAGTDGAYPNAELVQGSDGALYGTTSRGGASGLGTLFRIDPAGMFESLHSFSGTDGRYPQHALVLGRDDALYGLTGSGGSQGEGEVFKIDSAGNFSSVHSFNGSDGRYPFGPLALGNDGALYGTTAGDYTNGVPATVFRIDSAGTFSSLHSFGSGASYPTGPLALGNDGALYWADESGQVFRIDSAGNFTTLYTFIPKNDGPYAIIPSGLVLGSDGALYGTTNDRFSPGLDEVFRIDSVGNYTSLHSLNGAEDGQHPTPALALGSDGALYGTTERGGMLEMGSVFRIDGAGTFSSLHPFGGTDGAYPTGALVPGSNGALYGVTQSGGSSGYGSTFTIDSEGAVTALYSFTFEHQSAVVVPGSDGTTYASSGNGYEVFKIDNAGASTSVHSFPVPCHPDSPASTTLAAGHDGAIYGIHTPGSVGELACFGHTSYFRIDSAGSFTTVDDYAAALVLGSDGALYGTTAPRYPAWAGTVFRIDGAGNRTTVYQAEYFDPSDLVVGSDGALYGLDRWSGNEAIFRIDTEGSFATLHSFHFADASYPSGPLAVGSDCALYGTVPERGPRGGGFVFRLYQPGHLCQHLDFDALPDRAFGDPPFTVSATASAGLPVSFTAVGSCSVSGDQISLTGAGLCTITASQPGDSTYGPAPDVSQSFHVTYAFRGFLAPVRNPPAINSMQAGRSVPVRFWLGGRPGPDVLAAGSPTVQRVSCETWEPIGEAEPATRLNPRWLGYSWRFGLYHFLWKTDRRWAGSCRQLELALDDGSIHRANFRFLPGH